MTGVIALCGNLVSGRGTIHAFLNFTIYNTNKTYKNEYLFVDKKIKMMYNIYALHKMSFSES